MTRKIPERVMTHWLPGFGIVCAMLYYALFLYEHALNIPYADDIRDILFFLVEMSRENDWARTVELFAAQITDHRTTSSRLMYYLVFLMEGEANFRTLIFTANLGLPLLLLLLYIPLRKRPDELLILLPAALILFQLGIYSTSFWSMNAFAFMFVFVYGFACLLCLRQLSAARYVAAVLFATLSMLTLASGQLIWPLGLVAVVHQTLILKRAPVRYLWIWLVVAITALAIFRIDYISVPTAAQYLGAAYDAPLELAAGFLMALGRALSEDNVELAMGAGAVILLIVMWSSVRRLRGGDVTLELFAWYTILALLGIAARSAVVVSSFEAAGALPEGMSALDVMAKALYAPRYAFISVLLLATTVVLLASHIQSGRRVVVHWVVVLLALTYCVSSYRADYPERLQKLLHHMVAGHNSGNYWAFGDTTNESTKIVTEAEEAGVYNPPPRPLPIPKVVESVKGKKEP